MSIEKGTTALTIFRLPQDMPEDTLELFSAKAAKKLDDLQMEEDIGWVSGRHLLERLIDEETAICGGSYHVHLRIAQRKIPTALLQAECRMNELRYIQENDVDFVPSRVRREIKENIEQTRLKSMPPQITGVPLVIDRNTNILYLGTGSTKLIDTFSSFFFDTFQFEPIQLSYEDIMINSFNQTLEVLPRIFFSEKRREEDFIPGRDFLTWLWYYSESNNGGPVELENYGKVSIFVEGPLTFSLVDEAEGAGETVVKKGAPQNSAEAKAALEVGKKLKKAKLLLAQEGNLWNGTFDADKFTFSGLKLPDGEETEYHSMFEERVNFLNILRLAMIEYYKVYVENLQSDNWSTEKEEVLKWSAERDSL